MSLLARGSIVTVAAGTLCLSAVANPHKADADTNGRYAARAGAGELGADSLDDGPHIYWRSDSDAIVFYLCEQSFAGKRYEVRRTLRFNGFCGDSATEYVIDTRTPKIEPYEFHDVPKIFAVSDIHGEYEALVDLLQAAGVIDEELRWSWDDGHLVIVGDIFDRGDKVTECLWLLYRLEQQAREADGRVHVLLGNHEIMVMRNDLRYVNPKYTDGIVQATGINYSDLYGPDMELGRWLRTKHVALELNHILFTHGGISPRLADDGVSLKKMNEMVRATIDLRTYAIVFDEGALGYYGDTELSPFWFRGYHYAEPGRYARVKPEQVDSVLDAYDASAMVVGHTEVDSVVALYDGRVIGIDVPLEKLGSLQGLLWNGGDLYRVKGDGSRVALKKSK
jgi:hypothetical protein